MNFIEAVASGRRFRPVGEQIWWHFNDNEQAVREGNDLVISLYKFDYLGEWEIEKKSVTLTENQIDKIISNVNCKDSVKSLSCDIDDLKAEIGFTNE